MGSLQAAEMAEMLSIEDAIIWQLRSNHFPPVPMSMVQPCIEAINAYNNGNPEEEIDLSGSLYRGNTTAPAWAIIDAHHLHAWIELDEEYDDE